MSLRTKVAVAAAVVIAVPGLWFVATVSAHATIGTVAWNDAANPTKVIATSRGDDIRNEAGTFSLQVFDPSGKDITAGATVLTGPKTMEVAVSKPAAQGQYRVTWATKSAEPDGHTATGNLSLQLNAVASAPAPAASAATTTSPVAPPATGDGGLVGQGANGFAALAVAIGAAIGAAAIVRGRRVA
ncbi:MAG TPA: copper resistance protein CopC [Dehalococcoidia bacterium]|nr:copper resistance protein CopC [Dehalococcoidia bacterium]